MAVQANTLGRAKSMGCSAEKNDPKMRPFFWLPTRIFAPENSRNGAEMGFYAQTWGCHRRNAGNSRNADGNCCHFYI
jgi:hypothetical protein